MDGTLLKRLKKHWQVYVFLLLPLTYLILFCYVPMAGVQIAFKRFSPQLGIWRSPWVGLAQFQRFFGSYQFERVLTNTLRVSVYALAASFPIPIAFALVLNTIRDGPFKKSVQTITYMPHFISTVVLVGMILQITHPIQGLYGRFYTLFGGQGYPRDILGFPETFPHLYVWSGVWQSFGWSSIIYVAALSAVSGELHEAAQIDGASRFQRVLHVDLPSILPTATIMLILRSGQVMSVGFEKVFLMQNNLNLRMSEVISTYVYKVGLGSGGLSDFSYATAIGLFNSAINLILILLVNRAARLLSENSLW